MNHGHRDRTMTTKRTDDSEMITEQEILNEGNPESRYRLSEKTIRILKRNEKIKPTPMPDDFFDRLRNGDL